MMMTIPQKIIRTDHNPTEPEYTRYYFINRGFNNSRVAARSTACNEPNIRLKPQTNVK